MRRAALLVGLMALGATLVVATPAQAHNFIVSSSPEAGSTISVLPESYSVTTNGTLLVIDGSTGGFAMQVRGADGLYYGDGCILVEGATLSMPATIGEAGDYTVLWQLISEDGHPVSGEFAFTWAPDATAEATPGFAEPPVCGQAPPEPSTSPTATPTAEPQATPSAAPVADEPANLSNVLWIGGGVLAVLVAGLVTLLVLTRKRRE